MSFIGKVHKVGAHIAPHHGVDGLVVTGHVVGASLEAGLAVDALLGINRHSAGLFALGNSALRANLHANRRCAVVDA